MLNVKKMWEFIKLTKFSLRWKLFYFRPIRTRNRESQSQMLKQLVEMRDLTNQWRLNQNHPIPIRTSSPKTDPPISHRMDTLVMTSNKAAHLWITRTPQIQTRIAHSIIMISLHSIWTRFLSSSPKPRKTRHDQTIVRNLWARTKMLQR